MSRYNPLVADDGIRLTGLTRTTQAETLRRLGVGKNLGAGTLDVLVEAKDRGKAPGVDGYGIVGVIHVKASVADRIREGAKPSRAVIRKGVFSIPCTLDVKSFPPPDGGLVNRGKFGTPDTPSEKRRYIESHADFSAAFSFNRRTEPTAPQSRTKTRVYRVDLRDDPDELVKYLRAAAG